MKNLIAIGIICLVFCCQPIFAQSVSFFDGAQMLRVGQFHNNEVTAKSEEVWLGLFPTQCGYELKSTTISVKPVHDAVVDSDTSIKTGWLVDVNSLSEPIVLIRGTKNLKECSVKTYSSGPRTLIPGTAINITTKGDKNSYSLCPNSKSEQIQGGTLYTDYTLKLSFDSASQVIAAFDGLDDSIPVLVWAGDIDGDGKLDLLLDLTNHYNVSQYTLFLSSAAKTGELVRKVTDFRIVGC